jgi:hypothetical protein
VESRCPDIRNQWAIWPQASIHHWHIPHDCSAIPSLTRRDDTFSEDIVDAETMEHLSHDWIHQLPQKTFLYTAGDLSRRIADFQLDVKPN